MRFKNFLLQESVLHATSMDEVDDFVDMIENECSDILTAYQETGVALYRGDRDESKLIPAFKKDIRTDRKPVQMVAHYHTWIDDAYKILKVTATRKNSIFCTANPDVAGDWGTAFIVFPQDAFSTTVHDRDDHDLTMGYNYNILDSICNSVENDIGKGIIDDDDAAKEVAARIKKKIPPLQPRTVTAFERLLKKRPMDVLIHAGWWIGVNPKTEIGQAILKKLYLTGKAFKG